MQTTTKISGKVTLQTKVTNALKGLQIDLFDTNIQLGWLAGSKIKSNGSFTFSINAQAATPVTLYRFRISKNNVVVHQVDVAKGAPLYSIDIPIASYESVVNNIVPVWNENNDYFILNERVLNFQNQPLSADIVVYESLYKTKRQIAVTSSNTDVY
jgi:hypothetical protein